MDTIVKNAMKKVSSIYLLQKKIILKCEEILICANKMSDDHEYFKLWY